MRDHSEWYPMTKKASFKELLNKDKAVSIHTRNLQILVTEMFKIKIGESPSIMHEIFQVDDFNNYNLRKKRGLKPGNLKAVYYVTETISVLGPKLRIILPDDYKNSTSLKAFKTMMGAVSGRHIFQMLALFNFNYK